MSMFFIVQKQTKMDQFFGDANNISLRSEEKCAVSCTTLDGEFLRYPQMVHLHDPPTKGKKLSMQFVDRVATEVPKSNQPLQRIWEKTQSKFLREIYSDDIDPNDQVDFEDFALSCPQFDNRRTRLQKIRRKDTPVLPKTREAIELDRLYITTLYKKRFLLFDTLGENSEKNFREWKSKAAIFILPNAYGVKFKN